MRFFFLIMVFSLLFGRCNDYRELVLAENLIHSKPDSSLVLLNNWRATHSNLSKEEQGRYSLLMSMALDKNYIDVASDSIIQPAVRYYSSRMGKERMLAYYYQGLVYKNMKSYSASIVALEKAEADAKEMGDSYQLGLINRNKAVLFNEMGDFPAALSCAKESLNSFSKAEAILYAQYARLTLATVHINAKDYNQALIELDSLSHETDNTVLIAHLTLRKAHALWCKNAPANEIISLYRQVPYAYYDVLDYGCLASAFDKSGQKDSADYYLNIGYDLAPDMDYKVSLDFRKAEIEKSRGNYRAAYKLLNNVSIYQDSLTRVRLAESISAAQRDYFKQERDLQAARANMATAMLFFGIVVFVFILVLVILLFVIRMNQKEAQLREELVSLRSSEDAVNKLSSDNAFLIGGLVSEKLKDLEALSNEYCLADSEAKKDNITKKYKEALAKLRNNPAIFTEIEDMLNLYCGNLMYRFREQFPRIKGEKLKLAILFFTRMPYKRVELFFRHYTADSLKQAKNRFRKIIQESSAPDKELFLISLEMKKGGHRPKQ